MDLAAEGEEAVRYARRVQVVEAQRWLGGKPPVSVLTGTGAQVHPDGQLLGIVVPEIDQLIVLGQGDWLLRDERGRLSSMGAADFDAQFELLQVPERKSLDYPRKPQRTVSELLDILGHALGDIETTNAGGLRSAIDDALEAFADLGTALLDDSRLHPADGLRAQLLQPLDAALASFA